MFFIYKKINVKLELKKRDGTPIVHLTIVKPFAIIFYERILFEDTKNTTGRVFNLNLLINIIISSVFRRVFWYARTLLIVN